MESDGNFQLVRKWSTQRVNPIADNGELTCTVTVAGAGSNAFACDNNTKTVVGHKYYITTNWYIASTNASSGFVCGLRGALPKSPIPGNPDVWNKYSTIGTVTNSSSIFIATLGGDTKVGDIFKIKNVMVTDLTKMFGAGNEPSTPEEFEALFPEDYYPYNEGTLMSIPVNEVVEKGRNLFDEKMELGLMNYDVNSENFGENIASKNQLRSSNYIPVEPNTQYFFNSDRAIAFIYDAKRKPIKIGSNGYLSMGRLFTTPSNARYLKFYLTKEYGIIYNSDLMLTKGATTAYLPYRKNTYPIPQAILNLDGYGDGVSDDVYNYVDWENKQYHKRVGKVDLGSLTYTNNGTASDGSTQWKTKEKISKKDGSYVCVCPAFLERRALGTIVPITNGICDLRDDCSISLGYIGVTNAEDFAQAMQGIMLYYELNEEQIIDISDIIDSTFQEPIEVEAGGTLTFHNSNGDGCQLPIPNEEEYIVSLADIGGGASE